MPGGASQGKNAKNRNIPAWIQLQRNACLSGHVLTHFPRDEDPHPEEPFGRMTMRLMIWLLALVVGFAMSGQAQTNGARSSSPADRAAAKAKKKALQEAEAAKLFQLSAQEPVGLKEPVASD